MSESSSVPILQVLAGLSFLVAVLILILSLRRGLQSQSGNRPIYFTATGIAGFAALACLLVVAGYSGPFAVFAIYLGVISGPVWLVLRHLAMDSVRYSAHDEPSDPSEA